MKTVYRVEWRYFDGCDEFTSTLEVFDNRELAQDYVSFLEIVGLYMDEVNRLTFDCKLFNDSELHAACVAAGIPDVVFRFHENIAGFLKIPLIELPLPRKEGDRIAGGYNIYEMDVLEEKPEFMT